MFSCPRFPGFKMRNLIFLFILSNLIFLALNLLRICRGYLALHCREERIKVGRCPMERSGVSRGLWGKIRMGRLGGLVVSLGISLAACQGTEGGAALSFDMEGDPTRSFSKNIVGGVISKVRMIPGSRTVSLVIRETRLTRGGRPLCRRPTGRRLSVERVAQIFSAGHRSLKSAFVVTGEVIRPQLRSLHPGDCVSVVPEDVVEGRSLARGPMIDIEEDSSTVAGEERMGEGEIEVWGRTLRGKTLAAKASPPKLHSQAASLRPLAETRRS